MSEYDGEIRIKTLIENGEASSKLMQMESQFQKLAIEADKFSKTLKELASQKIPTEEYKAVQMQIEKDTASLDKLLARMDKFLETGGSSKSTTFKRMQYDAEELTNSIKYAKGELAAMESSGTAFIDPTTTEEYSKVSEKLLDVQSKQEVLNQKMRETAANEKSIGSGAKDIEKVGKSAKKSSGLISDMAKRIKQTVFSFAIFGAVMKVSQTISKAFTEGIQNMAKYSSEFNGKMSEMASASATLKNSIGALTAPIISALTPAIVTLCTWLTNAINAINRFIAAISGKSTWTKAKKQQVDYAASLDKTAGSAKKAAGALAAFDDLNVLQKNDSGSGSGGTGSGGSDLYEEVPTSSDLTKKLQPFLDFLKKTKASIEKGWSDTWKKLDISSQLVNIKASSESINNTLADIFTDPFVLASVDNFVQTVAYSLGSMAASVTSIGATIAQNLIGGMSQYMESNTEGIKAYIINMLDISSNIADLVAQFSEAFANVFSAFGSENGQTITANLIQMFSDAFAAVTTVVAELANDLVGLIVTPFVDNQDAIKTALEGLLGVVANVTTTISNAVNQIATSIVSLYDEHIHPFIESVTQGISDILNQFLEFWNTYMQPILDELSAMIDDTYNSHLKPVIDSILEIIGSVIDIITVLWENLLKPLISWIIENILPVIAPILSSLFGFVKGCIDGIIDLVGGLLSAVSDVFSAIKKIINGDWKGAWDSAKKIVKDVVNGILSAVESMANGVVNAINTMIRALNGLHFEIPDWVPVLGGKSFGFSINEIASVKLPRLANGGITTGSTLAQIGEAGREAVLPLENNTGWMDDLASKLASKMPDYSGAKTVVLAVDGKEFARINLPYLQDEEIRLGIAEG